MDYTISFERVGGKYTVIFPPIKIEGYSSNLKDFPKVTFTTRSFIIEKFAGDNSERIIKGYFIDNSATRKLIEKEMTEAAAGGGEYSPESLPILISCSLDGGVSYRANTASDKILLYPYTAKDRFMNKSKFNPDIEGITPADYLAKVKESIAAEKGAAGGNGGLGSV